MLKRFSLNLDKYFSKKQLSFVILLTILSFALRLWHINSYSFWLDETHQLFISIQSISEIFKSSLSDPNAPLYSYILHFWVKIFGISRFSTNFLSTFLNVLGIISLYFFTGKHFNFKIASLSSLFLSLSEINLYYSHETRSYTLLILFSVLSFWLFFEVLQNYKSYKFLLLLLINILLIFTHLSAALIFPAQVLYTLFYFKNNKKQVLLIYLSYFISFVLLFLWIKSNKWFGGNETVWLDVPDFNDLIEIFIVYLNNKLVAIIVLAIVVLYFIIKPILIFTKKTKADSAKFILLLFWSIFPIIAAYLVSKFYNPRFIPRYMILATPGIYIFIAFLISELKLNIKYFVLFGLILIYLFLSKLDTNPKKPEDWDIAVDKYKSQKTDSTLTLVSLWYQYTSFAYYYDIEIFKDYKNTINLLNKDNIYPINIIDTVKINFEKYDRVAVFISHNENNNISDYFKKKYPIIDVDENLNGLKYYMFDLNMGYSGHYFFDFEDSAYIENILFIDSSNVYHLSDKMTYSVGINQKIEKIAQSKYISVIASLKVKRNSNKNFTLVCSLHDNSEKQYEWKGKEITCKDNNWQSYEFVFILPEVKNINDIIKVYLWNNQQGDFYIDDFEIKIL